MVSSIANSLRLRVGHRRQTARHRPVERVARSEDQAHGRTHPGEPDADQRARAGAIGPRRLCQFARPDGQRWDAPLHADSFRRKRTGRDCSRAGFRPNSFAATIVVNQLARAQTNYSGVVADRTARDRYRDDDIDRRRRCQDDHHRRREQQPRRPCNAINASGAGVTASIIADEGGHRLILKGPTGDTGAFTLSADAGADPGLSGLCNGRRHDVRAEVLPTPSLRSTVSRSAAQQHRSTTLSPVCHSR